MKFIYLLIFIFSNSFAQVNNVSQFISKENIIKNIFILGSDKFEGRGTGEPGGKKAAKFLAGEFKNLNLIPIGKDSSYFQPIRLHGGKPLSSSKLVLYSGIEQKEFKLWDDYLIYFSGEQTFIPAPIELVFVGYGIIAPEYDYNDYQSVNVEGKIVVFLDGEPNSGDELYFKGNIPTIYSYPEIKQRVALSRGAKGSILIPDIYHGSVNWEKLKRDFSFEDVSLASTVANNLAILFNPSSAQTLFSNSEYSLFNIYNLQSNSLMNSFQMNCGFSFKGDFNERDFTSSNIIGMVEGSDPEMKDSYLIISAHYDHLGIGFPIAGDSIYNGVFDNASGVSALLELARIFSEDIKPARSVIFIILTGEEKGLLGSIYYTNNPLKPLYKTIANINIDGIALFDKFKSLIGIGAEYSTLNDFLKNVAESNNVEITQIPEEFNNVDAFSKSDQFAFANAGIPSILILESPDYINLSKEEGLNRFINYSENIYHTPYDDLNQKMNFDAAVQHISILLDLSLQLVQSKETPHWYNDSPYIDARLHSIAEKK